MPSHLLERTPPPKKSEPRSIVTKNFQVTMSVTMSVTAIRVTESVTRSPSATQARCQNEKYGLRVTVLVRISLAYEYCTIAYSIGHAYDVLGRLLMYTANHGDNTHVTLFMLFGGDTAFGAKRQRSSQESDARVRHLSLIHI